MQAVLSIAGSDSGGGAGIQADLKTFEAHGVFGMTVLTAVTAQNTQGVRAIHPIPAKHVEAQFEAVLAETPLSAIKIGMLGNARVIRAVAKKLDKLDPGVPVVLDPVLVATSGDRLLEESAETALREELLPRASLITPNAEETAVLSHQAIHTMDDARTAAYRLGEQLPGVYVLITGAHRRVSESSGKELAQDLLVRAGEEHVFSDTHVPGGPWHGTGCTFSSAIAANLALGLSIKEAVKQAKTYVTEAMLLGPKALGQGSRLLRHRHT